MRAITVQQPWAWAIVHGGKTIENRTQNWSYRGEIAIHSGQRCSDRGMRDSRILATIAGSSIDSRDRFRTLQSDLAPHLVYGAIIGLADLVDVHPAAGCCEPWGESTYVEHGGRTRRHVMHLVLEDIRPLAKPIPCRGALGLWTPPADIADRCHNAASHEIDATTTGSTNQQHRSPARGTD